MNMVLPVVKHGGFLNDSSFSIIAPSDAPWASRTKCPTMPAVGVAQRKVHLGKASERTGSIPVAGAKVQRNLSIFI